MILNFLLIFSFIGLIAIVLLIFYYKRKYNSNTLLNEKQHPGFKENTSSGKNKNESDVN
jgi:hypothetical protein